MGININGTEVTNITFNGNPVTEVIYNGTKVWTSGLPEVYQDFILEVERFTTNVYVNSTTYENDEIIALTIDAGENGCTATYGGVTKTVEANTSSTLFWGKYLGVDDGTPLSGVLTVSGDYSRVIPASISSSKSATVKVQCLKGIVQWFGSQMKSLKSFFDRDCQVFDAPDLPYKLNITDLSFLLYRNANAISVPSNLIKQCTQVTDMSYCFADSGLTEIPPGLFDNNVNVTNFEGCFSGTDLTEIPEGLFANNVNVTNFESCFFGCTSLSGNTPLNNDGLELWELSGTEGYPETINGATCFGNCTGLANYTSIPNSWGGPSS